MKRIDVAIAIVCRGEKVLICRRRDSDHLAGFWEFPGGKVEPGESIEQACHRELREELDIEAEAVTACDVIEHDYPEVHVRLHPLICAFKAGEPKPLGCAEMLWIDPPSLRNRQFPPANQQLIEDLIRYFTARPDGPSLASKG